MIEENVLTCPHCSSEYLHQVSAEVFFRDHEDSEKGNAYFIATNQLFQIAMKNNPSTRRDGIRIHFTCEGCPTPSSLEIVQHKGITYTQWT